MSTSSTSVTMAMITTAATTSLVSPKTPPQPKSYDLKMPSSTDQVQTQTVSLVALRSELKAWEHAFAAQRNGRRATRRDIDQDPRIASKYKLYNRLRRISSSTGPQETHLPTNTGYDNPPPPLTITELPKSSHPACHEVKKHHSLSPTKNHTKENPFHNSPQFIFRTPTTQRVRDFVGPTPQRDGQAIGLFDDVSQSASTVPSTSSLQQTPTTRKSTRLISPEFRLSGPATIELRTPTNKRITNMIKVVTPCNNTKSQSTDPTNIPGKFEDPIDTAQWTGRICRIQRTPTSEGKRFFMEMFVTPRKKRRLNLEKRTQNQDDDSVTHRSDTDCSDLELLSNDSTHALTDDSPLATPCVLRTKVLPEIPVSPGLTRSLSFRQQLPNSTSPTNEILNFPQRIKQNSPSTHDDRPGICGPGVMVLTRRLSMRRINSARTFSRVAERLSQVETLSDRQIDDTEERRRANEQLDFEESILAEIENESAVKNNSGHFDQQIMLSVKEREEIMINHTKQSNIDDKSVRQKRPPKRQTRKLNLRVPVRPGPSETTVNINDIKPRSNFASALGGSEYAASLNLDDTLSLSGDAKGKSSLHEDDDSEYNETDTTDPCEETENRIDGERVSREDKNKSQAQQKESVSRKSTKMTTSTCNPNAVSHANFRMLKIGKKGYGYQRARSGPSRFVKRRRNQ